MARFYADENFPRPVTEALRRLGHDVLTLHDSGQGGRAMPDAEVLAVAAADGRILLTINRRDFFRLHRAQATHAGIVACTQDRDFAGQAARIHEAVCRESDPSGQLIRVNRPR